MVRARPVVVPAIKSAAVEASSERRDMLGRDQVSIVFSSELPSPCKTFTRPRPIGV